MNYKNLTTLPMLTFFYLFFSEAQSFFYRKKYASFTLLASLYDSLSKSPQKDRAPSLSGQYRA